MQGAQEKIRIPEGHSFRLLRWGRTLREVECLLGGGRVEPMQGEGTHWHFHPEMELTLFTAGQGTRFVGDDVAPFTDGDLVLLGPRLPHYWHARGVSRGFSLQWHFPPSHPFWAFQETRRLSELFQSADRGSHIRGEAARLAAAILHEMAESVGPARLACLLRLFHLLAVAPSSERVALSRRSFSLASEPGNQQAIARTIRHLVANFRNEVRIEELLRLSGMSRPTFARQFKKHAGRTVSELLNRLRLQAACRELAETDRSVLDLSLACGFSQVSFFNRIFRRTYKCSPTDYRERMAARR